MLDRLPDVRCIVARGTCHMAHGIGGIFSSCSIIEQFLHLDAAEPEAHFPRVSDLLTASIRKTSRRGGTGADTGRRGDQVAFALPEIAVGLWPCTLLPALIRAIGGSKAYELALLGN